MPSPKPTAEPSATYSRLELILLGIVLLVSCLARVMFFSNVAVEHFDELFKRKPTAMLAYELADLKIQLNVVHVNFDVLYEL